MTTCSLCSSTPSFQTITFNQTAADLMQAMEMDNISVPVGYETLNKEEAANHLMQTMEASQGPLPNPKLEKSIAKLAIVTKTYLFSLPPPVSTSTASTAAAKKPSEELQKLQKILADERVLINNGKSKEAIAYANKKEFGHAISIVRSMQDGKAQQKTLDEVLQIVINKSKIPFALNRLNKPMPKNFDERFKTVVGYNIMINNLNFAEACILAYGGNDAAFMTLTKRYVKLAGDQIMAKKVEFESKLKGISIEAANKLFEEVQQEVNVVKDSCFQHCVRIAGHLNYNMEKVNQISQYLLYLPLMQTKVQELTEIAKYHAVLN